MITLNTGQFKALLSKELKEAFRDKRAMLSDMSAMMIGLTIYSVEGVMS
jgi:hypothetical protein